MSQSAPLEDARSADAKPGDAPPVVVKKYANRRLYNTESSSYITLDSLAEMVRLGRDFVVYDAKTGEDITRSVLTQIIVEEESKGRAMLPTGFLRQLIGFYGNSMQAFLPSYLELSLDSFTRQQERMRTQMGAIGPGLAQGLAPNLGAGLGTAAGPQFLEDQVKQNLAMFDRAMKMFSPFAYVRPEDSEVAAPAPAAPAPAATDDSLNDLKKKIEEMQEQISRLASKG